jgi:hypothetical protein
MQKEKAIKTTKYFTQKEIQKHLENVEYIIMAAPSPNTFKDTPIHFTIFLNTNEELPSGIKEAVLDKFLEENNIKNPIHVMSQLAPVGFAQTQQATPMPMLLIQPQDINSIPHTFLHVIDFLADSENFGEVKEKSLTGWSYSYNSDK